LTPIIAITLLYAFGIIIGKLISIPMQYLLFSLSISVFGSLALIRSGQKPVYLMALMVVFLGIVAYQYSNIIPANDISRFADDKYVKITGSVADEPVRSEDNYRFTLKAKEIVVKGRALKVSGHVGISIKDPDLSLNYGNKVSVQGKLSKIISTSNPGITSFSDLMAKRNVGCQMFAYSSGVEILARSIGNPIKSISIIIKNRLISVIQRTMSEPYSSLLGSIVFGSQASPLSNELQDNYRTAGVIHLLVVSGTQVSIILSVALAACRAAGFSQNLKLLLVTFANLLFTVMTGAGPSILRAAVMSEAALVAKIFERENDFYNSLSLSALVLLLLNPLNLFDIGFQLSFLATWALFYVAPAIEERISSLMPQFLSGMIAVSLAPTIITTPVILFNFGQVSFVSVISNFLIIPWVEVTVILGFVSTLAGLIFFPLAYAINNTLTAILAMLNGIVYFFSALPFACRYFTPPGLPMIILYYTILILVIENMRGRINIRFKINKAVLLAGVLLFLAVFSWEHSQAASDLTVTAIDVGQGDSILIESSSGRNVLIDGGGKQEIGGSKLPSKEDMTGRSIVVPFLRKKGINELDLVVLTHPHDDHVGGLPYVLEKMKVDMVLDSGQAHTSRGYIKFLRLIEKNKIVYKIARAGQVIDLGAGVKGYILHPSDPLISGTESDLNNNSVVIRLVYGKTSFLLMGDTAFEGEERVMSFGRSLKSDVLKVGHHGSRTSTSNEFLDAVSPQYAVISVGAKNKFGHPTKETLGRLADHGIKVFRTDLSGAIVLKSDGNSVWLVGK
jgi:competence protein ComEC